MNVNVPCAFACRVFILFATALVSLFMLGCNSQDTGSEVSSASQPLSDSQASDSDQKTVPGSVELESHAGKFASLIESIKEDTPRLTRTHSYVGSDACRNCHANEHASWHQTFHRTMTQLATPDAVVGAFDDHTIESVGLQYRVYREGDEFWAEMPDPERMLDFARGNPRIDPKTLPQVKRRVLMTTGSHHYQTYWVAHSEFDTVMNTLPLVYLPQESRWIPREAAFIAPPDQPFRMITIWNDHCINCHSTGGNPGLKGPKTLSTSVGEMGISCEACHGPGENHVAHHSGKPANPASTSKADLVNPKELDHVRSSQICGQCHGVFIRRGEHGMKFAREGIQFRPGDDLHEKRLYMRFPDENSPPADHAAFKANRAFFRERWWDDGTILAAGREYTAMMRTPCFDEGQMSCLSCHSMHNSEPDDQLSEGMRTNAACTACHQEDRFNGNVSEHTHHASSSSGSECMNCHMPHTSYALFKAIRNHTISSPNVTSSVKHGVPNACNLCHLNETLDWTQQSLSTWYGHTPVGLKAEDREVAASVLWALKGDAAQRAVVAWHYGWKEAQVTSATDWMVPIVGQLLSDPYGVVRHIAERSVRTLSDFREFEFDFLAEADGLNESRDRLMRTWSNLRANAKTTNSSSGLRAVLSVPQAPFYDEQQILGLLRQRNDRPVSIKE